MTLGSSPSSRLVARSPLLLHVAQRLLDFIHRVRIARVLPDVVADLDGGTAGGGGKFDDDVERGGLFVVARGRRRTGEVICDEWGLD